MKRVEYCRYLMEESEIENDNSESIYFRNVLCVFENMQVKERVLGSGMLSALDEIRQEYLETFSKENWRIFFADGKYDFGACDYCRSEILICTGTLSEIRASIFHEFAHFIDYGIPDVAASNYAIHARRKETERYRFSNKKKFLIIQQREKKAFFKIVCEHFNCIKKTEIKRYRMANEIIQEQYSHPSEIFAESVSLFLCQDKEFKKSCPLLYAYVAKIFCK